MVVLLVAAPAGEKCIVFFCAAGGTFYLQLGVRGGAGEYFRTGRENGRDRWEKGDGCNAQTSPFEPICESIAQAANRRGAGVEHRVHLLLRFLLVDLARPLCLRERKRGRLTTHGGLAPVPDGGWRPRVKGAGAAGAAVLDGEA